MRGGPLRSRCCPTGPSDRAHVWGVIGDANHYRASVKAGRDGSVTGRTLELAGGLVKSGLFNLCSAGSHLIPTFDCCDVGGGEGVEVIDEGVDLGLGRGDFAEEGAGFGDDFFLFRLVSREVAGERYLFQFVP